MRNVYVDNNATTQVAPEVVDEMLVFLREQWGNPSSMHAFGGQVGQAVEKARRRVGELVGASDPAEIVFTSGGTESDNTAIMSALQAQPEKRHIITTRVEHPAVRSLGYHLRRQGYQLTELGVDHQGMLDIDELERAIRPDTAVISVMWANNETGVIFPIEEFSALARRRGVLFHTDAVQAVGKLPIDLNNLPIDMLSLSGHKLHGPKGIGALYVRKDIPFRPLIRGGHQEHGRRGGTEPVPNIVGLGKAAELAAANLDNEIAELRRLRDKLETGIVEKIPQVRLNGHPEHRLPGTTNLSFEYVEGEGILLLLSDVGVAASSGSACTSGSLEPSHVLRAMGIPFTFAHGSIRFSLSRYNTDEDIDHIIDHLPGIISGLREISPYYGSSRPMPLDTGGGHDHDHGHGHDRAH